MRSFRMLLVLFLALTLRAQGALLTATPSLPYQGDTVTFLLSVTPPPVGAVTWDFGNGTSTSGGNVATYAFSAPSNYTVRALFHAFNAQQVLVLHVAQTQVRVGMRTGPGAPFAISSLRLRWENGSSDCTVTRGSADLAGFLDLKFEGTGLLQARWLVDGVPLGIIARQLAFAGSTTLSSTEVLALPTTEPGEHVLSLRILAPAVAFQIPQIRYFVKVEEDRAPQVDSLVPSVLQVGEEAELLITGRNLSPGLRLSFGKDVAVVSHLRFPEPGKALVRIFVAPSARPSTRPIIAANRYGKHRGPAELRIESKEPASP